jgi:hypothetical protein
MSANDLLRPHSEVLDDVMRDCRSLSLGGRKHVDVSVTRSEGACSDEEEPVAYSLGLVYRTTRYDHSLHRHPIERRESVANLCLDANLRGQLDNPGFRTSCERIATEAELQVLARLHQLALLQKQGIVRKVTYASGDGNPLEVTEELIRKLAAGAEIPVEAYQIHDNFSVRR